MQIRVQSKTENIMVKSVDPNETARDASRAVSSGSTLLAQVFGLVCLAENGRIFPLNPAPPPPPPPHKKKQQKKKQKKTKNKKQQKKKKNKNKKQKKLVLDPQKLGSRVLSDVIQN